MAANNYSFDIDASAGVANATYSADDNATKAAGLTAGNPRSLTDVTNANLETQSRKRMKKTDPASVTDNEMAQSLVREAAVMAEFVVGAYGGGFATADAVNDLGTELRAELRAFRAARASDRARRLNVNIRDDVALTQLRKENAGIGAPLPGRGGVAGLANNAADVGTPYPTAVGGLVVAPTTLNFLNDLTLDQISALAEWANDDFGIVAGEGVAAQRNKLRTHYTV